MSEPPVTVYVRDWHPPDPELAEIPGRWRAGARAAAGPGRLRTWFCGPEGSLSADPPGPRRPVAALRAVGRDRGRPLVG